MVCGWFCEVLHWLACSSWTPGSAHVIAMHCTLTTHCDNCPAQVPQCKCSRVLQDNLADGGVFVQRWFYWLRTISKPLKESYKEEVTWWFAVELGRRLVFLILIVPLPSTNVQY